MKLIVGIDPGITAAVAFLGVDSGHCRAVSRRNFSFSEICEAIAEEGDPIIIASDTRHAPQLLKRIAATFGCRLCMPASDMMVGEKKRLTEGTPFKNDHERDALAAALRAKHEFSPLFEKIDNHLEEKGMKMLSGDAKELIVKGEAANIETAVKMLAGSGRKETRVISKLIESRKILELRERIRQLEKGRSILEQHARHLAEENRMLKKKMADAPRPRQKGTKLRILEEKISLMRQQNRTLKNEIEGRKDAAGEDVEIVYPFREGADLTGKVVVAGGKAEVKAAEKQRPKAIICSHFITTDIPLIQKDSIAIRPMGNLLVVGREELEKGIQESFLAWLKNYRERYAQKA